MAFQTNLAHTELVNKVGTQLHPFVYLLSVTAFILHGQS